jgi:hypothetical protein
MDVALREHEDAEGLGDKAMEMGTAILIGLAKNLTSQTYFRSLDDALQAMLEPNRSAERVAGSIAANFVPFASGLRFINPDPHLRDARSVADRLVATMPGLSETLPPRRDVWGDPLTVNKGFWAHGDQGIVDQEMRRAAAEAGVSIAPPAFKVHGADLRDVIMVDGRNAYDRLQELAGKPSPQAPSLKTVVARIMATKAYQQAPDGPADLKGTKLYMITGRLHLYREAALTRLKADPNVREALGKGAAKVRAAYAAQRAQSAPPAGAGGDAVGPLLDAFGLGRPK